VCVSLHFQPSIVIYHILINISEICFNCVKVDILCCVLIWNKFTMGSHIFGIGSTYFILIFLLMFFDVCNIKRVTDFVFRNWGFTVSYLKYKREPLHFNYSCCTEVLSNYFFSLFICVFCSWGTSPSTFSNSPTEDKLNKAGVDRSSTVIAKEPEGKPELIFQLIHELLSLNFLIIYFYYDPQKTDFILCIYYYIHYS
jgi:hypothetical protein